MYPSPRRNPEETAGKKLVANCNQTSSDNTNTKGEKQGTRRKISEQK